MDTTTENGAPSYSTTSDPRLDLFFKTTRELGKLAVCIPFHLQRDPKHDDDPYEVHQQLYRLINASWMHDELDTMRILMNWRDCRGGKGDYDAFIVALEYLNTYVPNGHKWVTSNLHLIPEYGSWLDLIKLWHICPSLKDDIMDLIVDQLKKDLDAMYEPTDPISLLAKWIPSENSKWDRYSKDRFCLALCKKLTHKSKSKVASTDLSYLRKVYIAPLRKHLDLVETKLCTKSYDTIDYSKVPSSAMNRYKYAFAAHGGDRYKQYIVDLFSNKAKINASQVYPHDLVKQYLMHTSDSCHNEIIEAQWNEIKTKAINTGAFNNAVSVVDVSGSMSGTPMHVAIALGLLSCGEWNGNQVITFSEDPSLYTVPTSKTLKEQVDLLENMPWGCNTNFDKVIDLVHNLVTQGNPIERIFIFSDMQFDKAMDDTKDLTHMKRLKAKFESTNHPVPQIIFWNLRGNTDDFPVAADQPGVVMLSGYSPSLLSSIMDNEALDSLNVLFKIIRSPRYDKIIVPKA